MIQRFDHTYSYLLHNDLDAALERFGRAGFRLMPDKRRHPMGHLNGFVELTGTYLEFISIVDEAEFEREAESDDRLFRTAPRPYALGAVVGDPEKVYSTLVGEHPAMEKPYSRGETGKPDGPILWTFCAVPEGATPGAHVFSLKYHAYRAERYALKKGANGIFTVGGYLFCSADPAKRVEQWARTLRPLTDDMAVAGREIRFGFQRLEWIDPMEYQRRFGQVWSVPAGASREICGVILQSDDLAASRAMLSNEDFHPRPDRPGAAGFDVLPDDATGYAFRVEKGTPEKVLRFMPKS